MAEAALLKPQKLFFRFIVFRFTKILLSAYLKSLKFLMAHSWIYSLFFSFTKILLSAYAAQPGSSMATRRSSRTSPTDSRKPNGCFIFEKMRHPAKQKGHFSQKKTLSLSAEATINAAGKDRIYVIFFLEYKDRDLITHEPHCHHLCYKSFTYSDSCSFPNASPMINPENASTYPLLLLQSENTNGSVRKQ